MGEFKLCRLHPTWSDKQNGKIESCYEPIKWNDSYEPMRKKLEGPDISIECRIPHDKSTDNKEDINPAG